jgi:hypothetical protein
LRSHEKGNGGLTNLAAPLSSPSSKAPRHRPRELPLRTAKAIEIQVFVPVEWIRSDPHVRLGGQ